jgi:hypothetical protein
VKLTAAIVTAAMCALPSPAGAQAPATPPLVLLLPSSARTASLGNAWVAGRDAEVIFYNPAQLIGARQEFGLSIARPGEAGTMVSIASTYAAGRMSLTLGWGVQVAGFAVDAMVPYPYARDALLTRGDADGLSALIAFGGAIVYKGFRIGGAGKYVSDHVRTPPGSAAAVSVSRHAWLADIGVARNVLRGVAAFSVQNIGRDSFANTPNGPTTLTTPRQYLAGWSTARPVGPLDLGLYSQVTMRKDWIAPAGGVDVGYSWIDGYSVAFRLGARRPETLTERPVSVGAAFTADRLTIEYAMHCFDAGRTAHGVTVRWR